MLYFHSGVIYLIRPPIFFSDDKDLNGWIWMMNHFFNSSKCYTFLKKKTELLVFASSRTELHLIRLTVVSITATCCFNPVTDTQNPPLTESTPRRGLPRCCSHTHTHHHTHSELLKLSLVSTTRFKNRTNAWLKFYSLSFWICRHNLVANIGVLALLWATRCISGGHQVTIMRQKYVKKAQNLFFVKDKSIKCFVLFYSFTFLHIKTHFFYLWNIYVVNWAPKLESASFPPLHLLKPGAIFGPHSCCCCILHSAGGSLGWFQTGRVEITWPGYDHLPIGNMGRAAFDSGRIESYLGSLKMVSAIRGAWVTV